MLLPGPQLKILRQKSPKGPFLKKCGTNHVIKEWLIHTFNECHQKITWRYLCRNEIEKALDQIRPALQADGGNVELVEGNGDGVVKVKLTGACGHCPMSTPDPQIRHWRRILKENSSPASRRLLQCSRTTDRHKEK